MMNLVEEIRESWGWAGLDPVEVVGENDFGNLMVKDSEGRYWRLCPEEGYCKIVASNRRELDALSTNREFLGDWYMSSLVSLAREHCGPLTDGSKYCLKIPAFLGGAYARDNIGTISLIELIHASGEIAKQTKDLPDGTKVRLRVVD
jgi:hypothetical protein